jgi:hypothetical protein
MVGSFLKLRVEFVFPEGVEHTQTPISWSIETVPSEANAVFFVDNVENSAFSYERTLYLADVVDVAKITVFILQNPTRQATYTVHVFNPVIGITLVDDNGKTDSTCVVPNSEWQVYAKPIFTDGSLITPKLNWQIISTNKGGFLKGEDNFTRTFSVKGYDTANIVVTVLKPDGSLDPSLSATYKVHAPKPISFTLEDGNGKTGATYEVGNDVQLHAKPVYEAGIDVVPQVAWLIDDDPEKVSFTDNNSGSLDRTLSIAASGTFKITATALRPDGIADPDRRATYTLHAPVPEPRSLILTDKDGKIGSTCDVGTQLVLHVEPKFVNDIQEGLFKQGQIPLQIVWLINGLPEGESSILSLRDNSSNEYSFFIKTPADAVQITVAVRRSDGTADPVRRAVYTLHIPVPEPTEITLRDTENNSSSKHVVGDELTLRVTHRFANETQKALQKFPPVVWSITTEPSVAYTTVTFTDNNLSALDTVRTLSVVAPMAGGSTKVSVAVVLPDGKPDPNRCATYTLQISEPVKSVKLSALNENGTWKKGDTLHLKAERELESGVVESITPRFAWWVKMDPPTAPAVVSFINSNSGTTCSLVVEGYGTARIIAAVVQPDGKPHPDFWNEYTVQVPAPEPIGINLTDLSGKTDSICVVGNLLQLHAEPLFADNIRLSDLQIAPKVIWQVVDPSGKESFATSFVDNNDSAFYRTLSINEPDTLQIIAAIRSGGVADLVRRDTYFLYIPVPEPVSITLTNFEGSTSSTHVVGEQIDVRATPIFMNAIQNNLQIVPEVEWKIENIPSDEPSVVDFTVDGEAVEENAPALARTLFIVGHGTAHITVSILQPDGVLDPIRRATYTVHAPLSAPTTPAHTPPPPDPPVSLLPTVQNIEQPAVVYEDAALHLRRLSGYTARLVTLTGQVVVAFTVPTDDYRFPLFLSPAACILFVTDGVTQRTFKLLVD